MEIPSEAEWKERMEKTDERKGLCYYFPCNPFGFSLNSDMFIVWLYTLLKKKQQQQNDWVSQLKTLGMVQSCLGSIIEQNVLRFILLLYFFHLLNIIKKNMYNIINTHP